MDKQAQHESERAYLLTWKHVACQYADVLAVVAGVQLCLHKRQTLHRTWRNTFHNNLFHNFSKHVLTVRPTVLFTELLHFYFIPSVCGQDFDL